VSQRHIVDLSHPIRAGLITYPGLPAPVITPHLSREQSREKYSPGTEFAMDVITMIGNTGTYLDSPFHRYADGADLAGLDLSTLVGLPAEVFHLGEDDDRAITAERLAGRELRGAAVLLHTGWDRHFGTERYGAGAPFVTEDGARHLVEAGAVLVGDRLGQHRRHRIGRSPPGAYPSVGRRGAHRRTPDQPRRVA
jgi:arylformamidase